jgi:hypothetical protein
MDWIAVPEPVTWKLPKPGMSGGLQYDTLTVGAPTSANVLKASAVHGASGLDITLRMIEATSAENVPTRSLPSSRIGSISRLLTISRSSQARQPPTL